MNKNPLESKSYSVAVQTIKLCKFLIEQKKEYIISKQLIRSATSVGANIREAQHSESRKDFVSKLKIAMKESNESLYWLQLVVDSEYVPQSMIENIIPELDQVQKLLSSSIATAKARIS